MNTDRGFVVVQISMNLVKAESASCSKTFLTSAGDTHEVLNIKVEEGTDVDEEEIPMPVLCAVKVEQDEVSYVCVCVRLIRHTSPVCRNTCSVHVIEQQSGKEECVSFRPPTPMKGNYYGC
jgi:hypothetical protein